MSSTLPTPNPTEYLIHHFELLLCEANESRRVFWIPSEPIEEWDEVGVPHQDSLAESDTLYRRENMDEWGTESQSLAPSRKSQVGEEEKDDDGRGDQEEKEDESENLTPLENSRDSVASPRPFRTSKLITELGPDSIGSAVRSNFSPDKTCPTCLSEVSCNTTRRRIHGFESVYTLCYPCSLANAYRNRSKGLWESGDTVLINTRCLGPAVADLASKGMTGLETFKRWWSESSQLTGIQLANTIGDYMTAATTTRVFRENL